MRTINRIVIAGVALLAVTGCKKGKVEEYRGVGLPVETLMLNDEILVYRAMLWAAFPMNDPNISIFVDPLYLPRSEGLAGGDALSNETINAMKAMGVVKGTCQLPVIDSPVPLTCPADKPGYVVRFSQPYRMGAGRDTLQVHMAAQNYTVPNAEKIEKVRFERAYIMVRTPTGWKAAREGRLPSP